MGREATPGHFCNSSPNMAAHRFISSLTGGNFGIRRFGFFPARVAGFALFLFIECFRPFINHQDHSKEHDYAPVFAYRLEQKCTPRESQARA